MDKAAMSKSPSRVKRCWHCKKPVRVTVENIGLCRACIELARPVSRAKADRGNDAQFRKYAGLKGPGKARAK